MTFAPTFEVRGLVAAPHAFTRAELAALPQETVRDGMAQLTVSGDKLPGCSTASIVRIELSDPGPVVPETRASAAAAPCRGPRPRATWDQPWLVERLEQFPMAELAE
jgi:hypothetical protein